MCGIGLHLGRNAIAVLKKERIAEIRADHCHNKRMLCYRQWKEGQISKKEYLWSRDALAKQEEEAREQLASVDRRVHEMESRSGEDLPRYETLQELTKETVALLIERVEAYAENKVEISLKFKSEFCNC